jgi:hypothetical protein
MIVLTILSTYKPLATKKNVKSYVMTNSEISNLLKNYRHNQHEHRKRHKHHLHHYKK